MALAEQYLDLLTRSVLGLDNSIEPLRHLESSLGKRLKRRSAPLISRLRYRFARVILPDGLEIGVRVDPLKRERGEDFPQTALTMVGKQRIRSLIEMVQIVVRDNVAGDLIETGVWRGGASIAMKAALIASGDSHRKIFLADSFAGLPSPGLSGFGEDSLDLSGIPYLEVGMDEVRKNFESYQLLDDNVVFVPGWFHETLGTLGDTPLSLIRLDGDIYSSTWVALTELYPRLSRGGFVVVDDWAIPECQRAVRDYLRQLGETPEFSEIDASSVFWRKG